VGDQAFTKMNDVHTLTVIELFVGKVDGRSLEDDQSLMAEGSDRASKDKVSTKDNQSDDIIF
jgi:hypothetical protein